MFPKQTKKEAEAFEKAIGASQVIITGIPYPFAFDEGAIKAGGVRGQYLGDEQRVLLDHRIARETLFRTILHESLHGVFANSTATAGEAAGKDIDEAVEERLCVILEEALPRLFHDNPWLLEVLK